MVFYVLPWPYPRQWQANSSCWYGMRCVHLHLLPLGTFSAQRLLLAQLQLGAPLLPAAPLAQQQQQQQQQQPISAAALAAVTAAAMAAAAAADGQAVSTRVRQTLIDQERQRQQQQPADAHQQQKASVTVTAVPGQDPGLGAAAAAVYTSALTTITPANPKQAAAAAAAAMQNPAAHDDSKLRTPLVTRTLPDTTAIAAATAQVAGAPTVPAAAAAAVRSAAAAASGAGLTDQVPGDTRQGQGKQMNRQQQQQQQLQQAELPAAACIKPDSASGRTPDPASSAVRQTSAVATAAVALTQLQQAINSSRPSNQAACCSSASLQSKCRQLLLRQLQQDMQLLPLVQWAAAVSRWQHTA
jgi:hypothetical protein